MLAYFDGRPSTRFAVPPGVQRGRICYTLPGQRTCAMTVEDYYIPGSVPPPNGDDRAPPPAVLTPAKPSQVKPSPTPKAPRNNNRNDRDRARDRD
jgi:hypothetical protein